jgi:NADPH-dependent curcumin reductase CurA
LSSLPALSWTWLENAPRAFIGLFHGENIGKMLVRIAPGPSLM